MVALRWNFIIEHGASSMGVKVSGLQQEDCSQEMGDTREILLFVSTVSIVPILCHCRNTSFLTWVFNATICVGCYCYCFCLVVLFVCFSSFLKDSFITFLLLFFQVYQKRSKCRWCVVGKGFLMQQYCCYMGIAAIVLGPHHWAWWWQHGDKTIRISSRGWQCGDECANLHNLHATILPL